MTELERLYQNRHRVAWRWVYRRVRKEPAMYMDDRERLAMAAMYALGFRESPRALCESARYGGKWPGRLP
jgi:hypothetical protein